MAKASKGKEGHSDLLSDAEVTPAEGAYAPSAPAIILPEAKAEKVEAAKAEDKAEVKAEKADVKAEKAEEKLLSTEKWKVLETKKMSWKGAMTHFAAGMHVSDQTHGAGAVAALHKLGVKLEQLPPKVVASAEVAVPVAAPAEESKKT